MVSSAIWKKHARVSFSKTIKLHESEARVELRECNLKPLKNSRVYYVFQIARETILLLINNIHEKIMQARA